MLAFTTRPPTSTEDAYGMTAVSLQTVTIDATLRPWARGRQYRVEFWGDGLNLPTVVQLSSRPVDDDTTPECLGQIEPHDEVVQVDGKLYVTTIGRASARYVKLRPIVDPEKAAAGSNRTAAAIRQALAELDDAARLDEAEPYWAATTRRGATVHVAGADGFTAGPCRRSMQAGGTRLTVDEVNAIAQHVWPPVQARTGVTTVDVMPARVPGHSIRWFVYAGSERIPRTAQMRGTWGHDVECECGWDTRTGGATRGYVEGEVWLHKYAAWVEIRDGARAAEAA